VLSIQPSYASTVFYDTYDHWAEDDIKWSTDTLKVFKGYGDLTFRPENNITRGEFVTILARTAYQVSTMKEIYTSNMAYTDMSKHWSYTYVISMYEYCNKNNKDYSFTSIFPGSNFYPDKPITREEAIALIAIFCKEPIYDNPLQFSDVSENYKYYDELKKLTNSGVVTGYKDNTFRGSTKITRAEAAALIKRFYYDVKTSISSKYLTALEFLPIKGEEMYSFFGTYDFNTTNVQDKKFIKAKNTLEYIAFGGYIFPEDSYLYDLTSIETLNTLRTSGYYNVAGINFYLINFGTFTTAEKNNFANEMLANIIARNDLKDSELLQLFSLINKYSVKEQLYISALEKWYSQTQNNNAKSNILFFRYAYYIKTNNKEMLKTLIYEDLKKSNSIPSILNINWSLTSGSQTTDFSNYSYTSYNYYLYKGMTAYKYLANQVTPSNYNSKMIELLNLLLIKKSDAQSYSNLASYESIFYKYSINRLYVLNFINEKERAFVEGINDYEIIKTFSMYKSNKLNLDDNYTGILKKVKN
jgi:hypothetical protein